MRILFCCRCAILTLVVEMDRNLRPYGCAIFRDSEELVSEVEEIVKLLHWDVVHPLKVCTGGLLSLAGCTCQD
jgi:hypothetical protein